MTMKPSLDAAECIDTTELKVWQSPNYNYLFRKDTGAFARWGATTKDDPAFSPYGPEILDLEISTGECLGNCAFCYKCNGSGIEAKNMSLETFKDIFHKMPKTLTQIAFGITNIHSNPDFFDMMAYASSHEVIPNYTCHGLDADEEVADKTAALCGAVAVSIVNKEKSYNAIQLFGERYGVQQVNIHFMLSEETYHRAFEIVDDIKKDPRLKSLNAIVFLQYKPKGRQPGRFHVIRNVDHYKELVQYCEDKDVRYGFDSCSAPLFFKTIEDKPNKEILAALAEPCESFGMFSSYINVDGDWFPCSFCEGETGWEQGISVVNGNDFLEDVWYSERVQRWRDIMLHSSEQCQCQFAKICRSCPVFDVTACKKEYLQIA